MANRAFAVPAELGQCDFDPADKNWMKKEGEYVAKIVEYAKKKGTGSLRGKQIAIPMADGHALYIILTTSPLQVLHVPVGDKWHSPLINQLTVAAIKKMAHNFDPEAYNY
jgi:hypothetical protein